MYSTIYLVQGTIVEQDKLYQNVSVSLTGVHRWGRASTYSGSCWRQVQSVSWRIPEKEERRPLTSICDSRIIRMAMRGMSPHLDTGTGELPKPIRRVDIHVRDVGTHW